MSGRLQNQLMTISEMSELIGIANKTDSTDDFGAILQPAEEPEANIRAKVRYANTDEAEKNDQLKFATEIKVWTRYNENWTVEKLVWWEDNYYEIFAIEKTPGNRFHVIKAKLIQT